MLHMLCSQKHLANGKTHELQYSAVLTNRIEIFYRGG